jgi:ribosomal-protein-alanine N-acetyltransferase
MDRGAGTTSRYHGSMRAPHSPAPLSSPSRPDRLALPAGVTLGSARLRELPALARLQARAFPPRLAYGLGTLALLWALPWVRLLVARRNGRLVGCIIGDRTLEGGRVINLAVDPAARRQGVGTALLYAIEPALNAGDMTLMVQVENEAARALYRRVGYADVEIAANYYGPGRPGVRMRKPRSLEW